MAKFQDLVKQVHPGIFVHSVYIDKDLDSDRKAGFYGNVNEQVAFVADQLASIPELKSGFDAIGFSQGGQFLRAYVERYNHPSVNNLITFGSQHMGVSDIPPCRKYDFICQMARSAAKSAVYSNWAQKNIVTAQYYRDPANLETYLSASHFLAYINNEIEGSRNETYKRNLASLSNLVLVVFTEDETVLPKESSWFGAEVVNEEESYIASQISFSITKHLETGRAIIVPMRLQPIYLEDWIGLRDLDDRGAIIFEECEGQHMQLGKCWEPLVERYAGGSQY